VEEKKRVREARTGRTCSNDSRRIHDPVDHAKTKMNPFNFKGKA